MVRAAENEAIIQAVGLTKVFKDFWMRTKAVGVDNLDIEVHRHEIFGLLGPNGSGKSTTIKMILGLLHKTRGRLLVFGQSPSDVTTKQHIGFLPEESYLYRFLNPRETLDYYGKLFGLNRKSRRRRTDELLEMVGLTKVAHRPIGEFSKGMTRRIGLAQALINDPELLILDEPTSGLDPIGTRQVKDLILQLGSRGKTILLSSHLLADVEDVCDQMVILYGGKVRAEGTADELLSDQGHTIIKTKRLQESTIERINVVLKESESTSIQDVQAPRQRLEQLFLDIVERAQRESVETSGAQHGGETASFLRGEEADGDSLIDALVSEDASAMPANAKAVEKVKEQPTQQRDDSVLKELLEEKEAPVHKAIQREAPSKPKDVDSSIIDSLLSQTNDDDDEIEKD